MQKAVYCCDHCNKIIGLKRHISLTFGQHSGIATPPTKTRKHWLCDPAIAGRFLHFCNEKHLAEYFRKLFGKKK